MDITIIADKLNMSGGGSDMSLHLLATTLSNRNNNVNIVTINNTMENSPPNEYGYTIDRYSKEENGRLEVATNIHSLLKEYEERSDIYHIFNPSYNAIGGFYRYNGGNVPVIGRLNNYSFCSNKSRMNSSCYKNCSSMSKLRHSDQQLFSKISSIPYYMYQTNVEGKLENHLDNLFALSPAAKDVFANQGIKPDNITVVPNFYDPNFVGETNHDTPSTIDDNNSSVNLLYVGRTIPRKGIETLIDAVNQLETDNISVDIVGDGNSRSKLEEKANSLGLQEIVQFRGWVNHNKLGKYYTNADLFIHPGRWPEPFGRTILEAMQYECIPIVSNIGGPPWIIGDAGFVFEPNNEKQLVKSILEASELTVSEENEKIKKISQRVNHFTPEKVVDTIIERYKEEIR